MGVGIALSQCPDYVTWRTEFDSRQGRLLLFAATSRVHPAPTKRAPGTLYPEVKRPGREAITHLHPVSRLWMLGAVPQHPQTSLLVRTSGLFRLQLDSSFHLVLGLPVPLYPSGLQFNRPIFGSLFSSILKMCSYQYTFCNSVLFWALSIVYILIKLLRFGSWIFFRLQVKKGEDRNPSCWAPGFS
jgi:hypothetical protein